jgi:energy-coupling factor transporter ATP-binding protein EcfA2
VISVKNFTYTYPAAKTPALCEINLEVDDGQILGIAGANSSGKSTLCARCQASSPISMDRGRPGPGGGRT